MEKKLIAAKWVLHGLAIAGVSLALADNLGVLKDKDRAQFFGLLEENEECPASHPGASKFIDEFIYGDSQYENTARSEVDTIILGGRIQMRSRVREKVTGTQVTTGLVKIRNREGKVSHGICSIGDLQKWAHQSRLSKWVPWWIIAVSVFLQLLVFLVSEAFPRQRSR